MAEFTNDKMLPQSLEAEQAVLAAMFNDRDAILEVIPLLKESDFYRHDHGVLFATMRKMNEQNIPVVCHHHRPAGQRRQSGKSRRYYLCGPNCQFVGQCIQHCPLRQHCKRKSGTAGFNQHCQ